MAKKKPKLKTVKLHRRGFLNPRKGIALYEIDCSYDVKEKRKSYDYISADLTIGDCSRRITLDFGMVCPKDLRASLFKINKLRQCLDDIEDFITKAAKAQGK